MAALPRKRLGGVSRAGATRGFAALDEVAGRVAIRGFSCGRVRLAGCWGLTCLRLSTVGTWLREFTFGHVRQLDRVTETMLTRAWAAGAGPGDQGLFVDMDSTIVETHGYQKQGATYGYTKTNGYHPLVATRADTGEILHARMRKGSAGSGRGAQRFVREVAGRVRRAGATGKIILPADSGFWS